MADGLKRRTEDFVRYVAELNHRVATPEVHNLSALAQLASRVQRALAEVTPQEITWAVEQAQALATELTALQQQLATVAEIKRTLGGDGDRST